MGLKSASRPSDAALGLPPGFRRRLAALHARGVAGLLISGSLLAIAAGAALLALPYVWPLWLLLEGTFLVTWYLRKRQLDVVPDSHYTDGDSALDTFSRFKRSIPVISHDSDSYDLIGRWFNYVPIDQIKVENVRDLLGYGFGYRTG